MYNIDLEALEKAAEALASAKRIELYESGKSGIAAKDAHHKFFRIGIPCIAYAEPHMQVTSAALLSSKDTVDALSHTGLSKDVFERVKVAKSTGAVVIGITGWEKTPLAKYCDFVISANSKEVVLRLAPMTSRPVQLSIVDVLFVFCAMKDFSGIKENMDKVEMSLMDKRY